LIELSVVPVASKNTNSGEMPAARTAFTFRLSGPLVPEQANPAGGAVATATVTTATVTLCVADPPAPLQLKV
jgi:hypothetical protein